MLREEINMRKTIAVIVAACLLAGLLFGCSVPAPTPTETPTEAPATTAQTKMPTEAPTEQTEAPTEPPAADEYFVMVEDESCNHYTNGAVDILFRQDGSVVRADLASGAEETLFTVDVSDDILIRLIGVTNDRLYFGWNEAEDWWGVNVYSVDYQGRDRKEFGEAWDPLFEGGWLILLGFRSDVSPTELLLIDRYDEIVAEDQTGAVWDAVTLDESVYYVAVEDFPGAAAYDESEGGRNYELVRADADGTVTVLKVFENRASAYSPAFFMGDVLCFYTENEFYDVRTLEPTTDPNGLTGI